MRNPPPSLPDWLALLHELNQPLTSILSNAQAAQRFLAGDILDLEELREILQDIVADDKRAAAIVRQLGAAFERAGTDAEDGTQNGAKT